MQEQLDDLEQENAALQVAVKQGIAAQNTRAVRFNARQVQLSSSVADSSRKGEDIRRALLTNEDSDDAAAIDMDKLFRSRSTFAIILAFLLRMLPFKNDVRQVQARLGGSVASYFIFYRFMFVTQIQMVHDLFILIVVLNQVYAIWTHRSDVSSVCSISHHPQTVCRERRFGSAVEQQLNDLSAWFHALLLVRA